MSFLDNLTARFHALLAEAETAGHHGADEIRAAWAKFTGDAHTLSTEATADAMQIAQDVEQDTAPVIAEAKTDAENLAAEATADAKDLTTPAAPAAPQA